MNLGEAVYRLMSGGRSSARYDRYNRGWITEGLAQAGGVSQLARALGVQRTTVQRWQKGAEPSDESKELLRIALRQSHMTANRETRLRAQTSLTVRGDQDNRDRTIILDQKYLSPGTLNRAVTAYLRGASVTQLHKIVWEGIHSAPFYKTLFVPGGPGSQQPAGGPVRGQTPQGPTQGPGTPRPTPRRAEPDEYEFDDLIYEGQDLDDDYSIVIQSAR